MAASRRRLKRGTVYVTLARMEQKVTSSRAWRPPRLTQAARLCSEDTMRHVVDPVIANMQHEDEDARATGRRALSDERIAITVAWLPNVLLLVASLAVRLKPDATVESG